MKPTKRTAKKSIIKHLQGQETLRAGVNCRSQVSIVNNVSNRFRSLSVSQRSVRSLLLQSRQRPTRSRMRVLTFD